MAVNQAQAGIWSNVSVNSAHELGDRTLFQDRHYSNDLIPSLITFARVNSGNFSITAGKVVDDPGRGLSSEQRSGLAEE